MPEKTKTTMFSGFRFPWWAKIGVGIALMGLLLWKYPMIELLTYFFYVCLIPVLLFAGLGLISSGTVDAFRAATSDKVQDLKTKIDQNLQDLRDGEEEEHRRPPVTPADEVRPSV